MKTKTVDISLNCCITIPADLDTAWLEARISKDGEVEIGVMRAEGFTVVASTAWQSHDPSIDRIQEFTCEPFDSEDKLLEDDEDFISAGLTGKYIDLDCLEAS